MCSPGLRSRGACRRGRLLSRVAGLYHELVDYAVEKYAVVVAFFGEFYEVVAVGGGIGEEEYGHGAFGGVDFHEGFAWFELCGLLGGCVHIAFTCFFACYGQGAGGEYGGCQGGEEYGERFSFHRADGSERGVGVEAFVYAPEVVVGSGELPCALGIVGSVNGLEEVAQVSALAVLVNRGGDEPGYRFGEQFPVGGREVACGRNHELAVAVDLYHVVGQSVHVVGREFVDMVGDVFVSEKAVGVGGEGFHYVVGYHFVEG